MKDVVYSHKMPNFGQSIRTNNSSGDVLHCGNHDFGDNNICACGMTWEKHQTTMKLCPTNELSKYNCKIGRKGRKDYTIGCSE